jgi:hypothetical protein
MLGALEAAISSTAWKFVRFYPFDVGIQEANCAINVAAVECSIGGAELNRGPVRFVVD